MSRINMGSSKNLESISSDTLTSNKTVNSSMIELWSALEREESAVNLSESWKRPQIYDVNIAFSRNPRTEYDNIVNALTNLLLNHFVDKVEIESCLAPEIYEEQIDVEEESQGYNTLFEEPLQRNPSSESFKSDNSKPSECNLEVKCSSEEISKDVFSEMTRGIAKKNLTEKEESLPIIGTLGSRSDLSKPCSKLSLHKTHTVSYSDSDSLEDINCANYFSKYKGHDKNALVEFKNGNKYEGRISCFMMEGEGTYTWKDGTQFNGTFISGIAQGKGSFSWQDKSWYNGEMKNNLRHGIGVCVIQKVDRMVCYFGKWKNGQRNGKGIILFGEYDWYDGKWKNDKMHGFGLRQYPTGSRYLGDWKYGKPHGEGTMVWSQQDTYTGMWRKGKMHGKGTYTWRTFRTSNFTFPLQNMFDGYWKNGRRHGAGRLLLASGAIISSIWQDDLKEGPGQIICKNGLVLESTFLFSRDKLCNIGQPVIVPPWNKWYYDFLLPYQDGIVASLDIECKSCYVYDEHEKLIGNISPNIPSWNTKRKMCLNNIPLLAAVETMPLWHYIEKSFEQQGAIKYENGSLYITEEVMADMSFEELWLRKVLSNRMPDINIVYQHYAKIGCEKPPDYNCFLLKIMLWQLCLDCGIEYSSFTLCSLDNKLSFGSYPFDVIPTFQMINYLLYLTYDICLKNKLVNSNIPGLWGGAFDYFLSNFVLPGMKKKNTMPILCKHLPINELYYTYFKIGIPVTIIKILKSFSFNKDDDSLLTSPKLYKIPNLKRGKNLVNPDGSIIFEEEVDGIKNIGGIGSFHKITIDYIEASELTILENDTIRRLLISSCLPKIEETTVSDDYEVSFLEFCHFTLALLIQYKKLTGNFEDINDGDCNIEYENFLVENKIESNIHVTIGDRNDIRYNSKKEKGMPKQSQNNPSKDGRIVKNNSQTKGKEEKRNLLTHNFEEVMLDGINVQSDNKGNCFVNDKGETEINSVKNCVSSKSSTSSWNEPNQKSSSDTTSTLSESFPADKVSKQNKSSKEGIVCSSVAKNTKINAETKNTVSQIKDNISNNHEIFVNEYIITRKPKFSAKLSSSKLKLQESSVKGKTHCSQSISNYNKSPTPSEKINGSVSNTKRINISKYKNDKLLLLDEMNYQYVEQGLISKTPNNEPLSNHTNLNENDSLTTNINKLTEMVKKYSAQISKQKTQQENK